MSTSGSYLERIFFQLVDNTSATKVIVSKSHNIGPNGEVFVDHRVFDYRVNFAEKEREFSVSINNQALNFKD